MNIGIQLFVIFIPLAGCVQRPTVSSVKGGVLNYETLMAVIHERSIPACIANVRGPNSDDQSQAGNAVKPAPGENQSSTNKSQPPLIAVGEKSDEMRAMLDDAFSVWRRALAGFVTVPISSGFQWRTKEDGCREFVDGMSDSQIAELNAASANVSFVLMQPHKLKGRTLAYVTSVLSPKHSVMRIGVDGTVPEVLTHEVGHLLGLADMYTTNEATYDQDASPYSSTPSIMGSAYKVTGITADDVHTIRRSYCQLHAALDPACDNIADKTHSFPALNTKRQPFVVGSCFSIQQTETNVAVQCQRSLYPHVIGANRGCGALYITAVDPDSSCARAGITNNQLLLGWSRIGRSRSYPGDKGAVERFEEFIKQTSTQHITVHVAAMQSELHDYQHEDEQVIEIDLNTSGDPLIRISANDEAKTAPNTLQVIQSAELMDASKALKVIPSGTLLKYTKREGDWYYVNHEGMHGWIHRGSVREAKKS